ncbi:tRNA uridine-5-carboxymethylaminomethyl(34) synthesis GTPase MnmE [Mediterraneibacter agrestimuris]|uniref:tRNA uridine-5-carboxymethylaminomethyl(34) synthesis GTPase MnmE n=1 Tax=Mediterraneibacter agrestimuris TaxID=2941333 RepID=UPI0020410127|nr:tRNA uridine-5-carboxymethylaminomethyl(34) synthesis GTPase MnmE [Mediterraneibacter agrestimuris]
MYKDDTIAAISTGMSNSGIGIVRISGAEALQIIDQIYSGKEKLFHVSSHTIHYGFIKDGDETIDEVLVTVMRAPRTFTGEDTVEINCHGGVFVVKKILETVVRYGARLAEPGEFTKRAFLNGKMDLSQAEAVIDVIHSQNEYALKSSISQLKGSVKEKISKIREEILYHTAFIETALDDPEHISVDRYGEKLSVIVEELSSQLHELIESSENGRIIKEGIQTVILGKPNAGKSSLLNVLSGHERAIVTDIEGTTRDVLEEQVQIHGLNLNIIDTAGIRDTDDVIEKIGVDKAKEYADDADLIIYVADASRKLDDNDKKIIELIQDKKTIILLNKSDLHTVLDKEFLDSYIRESYGMVQNGQESFPIIEISAKEERGIQDFENVLISMFLGGNISFNNEVYITNMRQKMALQEAYHSLERVLESINAQMPEDFYSIDLIDAYEALGSITGETIGEDLVNEIFSKFCMGK